MDFPDLSSLVLSTGYVSSDVVCRFQKIIWDFYRENGRMFPWRIQGSAQTDPYPIFISEVMLQQTQTERVIKKFDPFIQRFPHFHSLALAPWADVLAEWQGLGYNRRGLYLHQSAKIIIEKYAGKLPDDPLLIDELPGIGPATAASICAFAFNRPTVFVETNIRSVFIKLFAGNRNEIDDRELIKLVGQMLEIDRPREWYYALMDYGVYIKKSCGNPNRRSRHYTVQSKFEGSDRQIRGEILRFLLKNKSADMGGIYAHLGDGSKRVEYIVDDLKREGIVTEKQGVFSL